MYSGKPGTGTYGSPAESCGDFHQGIGKDWKDMIEISNLTKIYRNIYESLFVDNMIITPTRFTHKQDILIGSNIVAIPGDQKVTFYLDSHRYFLASELFNSVVSIEVQQSTTDPRHFACEVVVKDLRDNKLSVASSSFKVI